MLQDAVSSRQYPSSCFSPEPLPPGDILTRLSQGWRFHSGNLYYFSQENNTWREAEGSCVAQHAHLSSVLSQEEQVSVGTSQGPGAGPRTCLGALGLSTPRMQSMGHGSTASLPGWCSPLPLPCVSELFSPQSWAPRACMDFRADVTEAHVRDGHPPDTPCELLAPDCGPGAGAT